MYRIGGLLGASLLGATVYEVPPGESVSPYHYEYGEEEWMLVLAGEPTVRDSEGTEVLSQWDVVCFPPGPEGAHAVRNDTDRTVRVLMFSNDAYPAATVYPDSDKVGVWTGNEDDDLVVHRDSAVEYFSGEQETGAPRRNRKASG
jgi:uncharacterized cupin superfamily protein